MGVAIERQQLSLWPLREQHLLLLSLLENFAYGRGGLFRRSWKSKLNRHCFGCFVFK